jgi:hypothetical protein
MQETVEQKPLTKKQIYMKEYNARPERAEKRNIANKQCGRVTKDKLIELYHKATVSKYYFFLFDKLTNNTSKMFCCCIDKYLQSVFLIFI